MRVLTLSLAAACAAALAIPAVAQEAGDAAQATPPAAAVPAPSPTPATADTVKAGAPVRDSAGVNLGTVDQAMLDEAGKLKGVAIKSPEGEVYALPAAGFSVQGSDVVAGWTKDQIDEARKARVPAKPGQS